MSGMLRSVFSGRGLATRREWWFAYLIAILILTPISMVLIVTNAIYPLLDAALQQPVVGGVIAVAMLAPMGPASVRRARARDLSVWWLAVFAAWSLLSPLLIRTSDRLDLEVVGNLLQISGAILTLWLVLQLGFLPSKVAPPPPEPAA